MRILLSGATGFVGKKLGLELVRRGHEVVAVVRNPGKVELPFPSEVIRWGDVPENIDAVIHLAGESIAGGRWTARRKEQLVTSRLGTTRQLVEILPKVRGRKPRVVLGASAVGIYGDRGHEVLTERSPLSSSFLGDLCRRWEAELFRAEDFGSRVAAFRIGVVLGRDGGALREMLPMFKLGVAGRLGSGRQWMSWIHWRDLVGIFIHALEHEEVRGCFNAVAPEPVTNADFTRCLADAVKAPVFLPAPEGVLKILLGEMSVILLASLRCSAGAIQASGYQFEFPDLSAALRNLCGSVEGTHGRYSDEYEAAQWVPARGVFSFFSDAKNLEQITPPSLRFRILSMSTPSTQKGTEILYRLRVHGVPLRWKTVITSWEPGKRFTDYQAAGPYSLWDHCHDFEELGTGTLLRDRVVYRLPLGWLSYAVAARWVAKDVGSIFDYRRQVISRKFGGNGAVL